MNDGVVHHAAITAAGWWAVIAAACTLATVASIGERLVVPARARHLPAPALISAVTISAALIWLALQHLFPDDPGTADTALYIATFIAASAATIILAITTDSGFSELGEDNIWIIERRREIASLHAIIGRLETNAAADTSAAGAGTGKRLPLLQIQTRGAHQSARQGPSPQHWTTVSASRSLDGLRRSTQQRSTETRRKITKALREMRRKGLAINPHALANYAGIARQSIYNHPDLLRQIRAESTTPAPRPAPPAPEPTTKSGVVAALREQLRAQKQRYETEIADLKADNKRLKRALAAAHGELHRRGDTGT